MNNTENQYRAEWAAKSGRPESEVYVPEALRPFVLRVGASVAFEGQVGRVACLGPSLVEIDWPDGERTTETVSSVDENGILR